MSVVNVNEKNFAETVKEGLILIDWWAPWCGPCRAFAPVYERVARKYPDVTFAKVNTEDAPGLAGQFQINAIPTLMVIKDGVLIYSEAGMLPQKALESLVQQAQGVDVNEARQAAAAAAG